jgi:N-hydroxyarylamine O-acetyltransferase
LFEEGLRRIATIMREGKNVTTSLDLHAYLARIQWGGEVRPTYDTLTGLLSAHMSSIPFENLDVLLGRPVRLELNALQDKLVHARRGGYCFEHGTLFAAVLDQLGFEPVRHTARVVLLAPRTASPRTHMFLTVPLAEGTFVVDPGFGALAPQVPVQLLEGAEAGADHASHWMARDGRYWVLRTRTGDKVVDCWVSTLEQENLVDFEVGNHFTATHPGSPFVNRIMMRALTADGRVAVMNRDVTVWRANKPQSTRLADRPALRALLVEHFGFDLPEVEQLRVPSIPEWG